MGYQLKRHEQVSDGIRRIATQQGRIAARHLTDNRTDGHTESVHVVRICVKKLRALLRLIRDPIGGKLYHRENDTLRTITKSLSSVRDVEVQLKTLQKLRHDHPSKISAEEFSSLQNTLLSQHEKQLARNGGSKGDLQEKLQSALRQIQRAPLRGLKRRNLRSGFKRSRRRFAEAFKKARQLPTEKNLHEWRKRTKDFYYQSRLIKRIDPKSARKLADRLKRLGEKLGDLHDLALLDGKIKNCGPHRFDKLQKLILDQRAELRQAAFKSARRLKHNFI